MKNFIKKHFAEEPSTVPFQMPDHLKLVLLAQDTASQQLIPLLAKKFSISSEEVLAKTLSGFC